MILSALCSMKRRTLSYLAWLINERNAATDHPDTFIREGSD